MELQGGISLASAEPLTLNDTGGGMGALRNVSGSNTWLGAITLGSASTITTASGSTFQTTTGVNGVIDNAGFLLTTDTEGTAIFNGELKGSGGLTKTGAGTHNLIADNTYAGVTNVNNGTLLISKATGLGTAAAGTVVASGATLQLNSTGITVTGEVLTISGTGVSSGGALRNFGGTNIWTGAIDLDAAATITTLAGSLTISTGGIDTDGFGLTFDSSAATDVSGVISDTGAVVKEGTGTLVLSNTGNSYGGATTINNGTLKLGASEVIPNGSDVSIAATKILDLNGFSETINSLAGSGKVTSGVAGNITLTVGHGNGATFSGLIENGTGVVSLTKSGGGAQILASANTYTGTTLVNAGELIVTADGNARYGCGNHAD